jgi:heptosyltransferase-1
MNILIIKTSSLGDIIHTFPALTDASHAIPDIHFDWIVEENFSEIPLWHPLVHRVIPVALRRWRKSLIKTLFGREWQAFKKHLRAQSYDCIIDAQGLLKSALLTSMAKGLRIGLNKQSLPEPLARFAYQKNVEVDLQQHAVYRMRSIFAQALDYPLPTSNADYQLNPQLLIKDNWSAGPYIVFLHGTTKPTKHWPEAHWMKLAQFVSHAGFKIRIPWYSEKEQLRAEKIAQACPDAQMIPRSKLSKIASILLGAHAAVSVDTGLGHLATALNIPNISLYGPTNPTRIGTCGLNNIHLVSNLDCRFCDKRICTNKNNLYSLSSACMAQITPEMVWERLKII